jgi:hypothetical protein
VGVQLDSLASSTVTRTGAAGDGSDLGALRRGGRRCNEDLDGVRLCASADFNHAGVHQVTQVVLNPRLRVFELGLGVVGGHDLRVAGDVEIREQRRYRSRRRAARHAYVDCLVGLIEPHTGVSHSGRGSRDCFPKAPSSICDNPPRHCVLVRPAVARDVLVGHQVTHQRIFGLLVDRWSQVVIARSSFSLSDGLVVSLVGGSWWCGGRVHW